MADATKVKYYIVVEQGGQTALERYQSMVKNDKAFYLVGNELYLGTVKLSNLTDIANAVGTIPEDPETHLPVAADVVSYVQAVASAGGTGIGDPNDPTSYAGRLSAAEDAITALNNNDTISGSVDYKIKMAIQGLINGAPATYDTLKEISDWIATHGTEAAALTSSVSTLESKVTALENALVWEEV